MLERDSLLLQIYSKEIVDRRIDVLKSGVIYDVSAKNEKSFFGGTLNLVGMLVLGLFLLLMPL